MGFKYVIVEIFDFYSSKNYNLKKLNKIKTRIGRYIFDKIQPYPNVPIRAMN